MSYLSTGPFRRPKFFASLSHHVGYQRAGSRKGIRIRKWAVLNTKVPRKWRRFGKGDVDASDWERMKVSMRQWSAKCESFLSSNGFTILFLISYVNGLLLIFFWGAHEEYIHTKVPVMRWFISVARGFGYVLNLNCGLVILLASRLTFTVIRETPLNLVIPFDKSFPAFHIIVAYILLGAVIGHGSFHLVWIIAWRRWDNRLWGINMCVGTGLALVLVLIVMVVSSLPSMRRKSFEKFYALHNICAVLFFLLLLLHGVYNAVPYTYKWLVPPLVIYAIDRIVRRAKTAKTSIQLSEQNSLVKGANILRLKIPKQFEYRAGQYAGKCTSLKV